MPFFSQFPDPSTTTHYFDTDWLHIVDSAHYGADVFVPNASMVQAIASKRIDLNVQSVQTVISKPITPVCPSNRCYWLQDITPYPSNPRLSVGYSHRTEHTQSHGIWLKDVWIDEHRDFGIEIELTSNDFVPTYVWKERTWRRKAGIILALLREVLGQHRVHRLPTERSEKGYTKWQVVYDESAGWEIVSPILRGLDGGLEVVKVVSLMDDFHSFGFLLGQKTGLHIHLSWKESLQTTKNLLHWWHFFEPSMATLVHPSRIFAHHKGYFSKTYNNIYCTPLSQSTDGQYIQKAKDISDICLELDRNSAINPQSIIHKKSIEFRIFESTSDPLLVLVWISLCQQIAYVASQNKVSPPILTQWETSSLAPTGDIVLLCTAFLPAGCSKSFMYLLIHRRRQVAALWCRNRSLRRWLPFIRSWRRDYSRSDIEE